MPISVAKLKQRRAKLDQDIKQAEAQARADDLRRRAESQAKFILGGLLLARFPNGLPDNLKPFLEREASIRRASDQPGWEMISAKWGIALPPTDNTNAAFDAASPHPPSAPPQLELKNPE